MMFKVTEQLDEEILLEDKVIYHSKKLDEYYCSLNYLYTRLNEIIDLMKENVIITNVFKFELVEVRI